jgi:glycosyltransferase involved in cell wall biosynthesis
MVNPKVSVVVPVYNVDTYLSRTFESLARQSVSDSLWEAIFIDDCSTDGSATTLKKLIGNRRNMCLVSTPKNLGVSGARNLGIRHACGDFIAQLDGDDMYESCALQVVLDYINNFPGLKYFYSSMTLVNERNEVIKRQPSRPFVSVDLFHFNFISPLKVFCKDVSSPNFIDGWAEDWEHPLRILREYGPSSFVRSPDFLYRYTIRGTSSTGYTNEVAKRKSICSFLSPHIKSVFGMDTAEVFWSGKISFEDGNSFNYYDWRVPDE